MTSSTYSSLLSSKEDSTTDWFVFALSLLSLALILFHTVYESYGYQFLSRKKLRKKMLWDYTKSYEKEIHRNLVEAKGRKHELKKQQKLLKMNLKMT